MATYYFRNANGNWNAANNWSISDGGPANGAVPTAADDAYFTSNSGQCTVTAVAVCKTLVFSGVGAGNYAGTFTVNAGITVSGNITLSSTMTITTTSGTPSLAVNATATLTSSGKTWPYSFSITGGISTIADTWTVSGNVTLGNITLNGSTLNCAANLTKNSGNTLGTTVINMSGTGTILASTGTINNPFTINTSGTITISGTCNFANNITYTSGTIATSGTPIININLNTPTITLNALFTFAGTIQTSVNITFAGTNGFNINSFICTTTSRTITWKNGNTYSINGTLTLTGSAAGNIVFVSSTPGSQYFFTLSQGGTQDVGFVNCTDANSSNGKTIWDYKGTLSNTTNWAQLPTQPKTYSYFS